MYSPSQRQRNHHFELVLLLVGRAPVVTGDDFVNLLDQLIHGRLATTQSPGRFLLLPGLSIPSDKCVPDSREPVSWGVVGEFAQVVGK